MVGPQREPTERVGRKLIREWVKKEDGFFQFLFRVWFFLFIFPAHQGLFSYFFLFRDSKFSVLAPFLLRVGGFRLIIARFFEWFQFDVCFQYVDASFTLNILYILSFEKNN